AEVIHTVPACFSPHVPRCATRIGPAVDRQVYPADGLTDQAQHYQLGVGDQPQGPHERTPAVFRTSVGEVKSHTTTYPRMPARAQALTCSWVGFPGFVPGRSASSKSQTKSTSAICNPPC